jgi:hypothetical protein
MEEGDLKLSISLRRRKMSENWKQRRSLDVNQRRVDSSALDDQRFIGQFTASGPRGREHNDKSIDFIQISTSQSVEKEH